MIQQADIAAFRRLTGQARHICIVSHTHPDGDAVGSVCALVSYLGATGKQARAVLPDAWPAFLNFLTEGAAIGAGPETAADALAQSDLLVCMDCNGFHRTAALEPLLAAFQGPKILIDHHLNPEREAFDLCISEPEISSTCELLFSLLTALAGTADKLPGACARALMTGMTTDTNNFANSVYPSTLRMASALLEAGVDRDEILDRLYNCGRENRVRAMGEMLRRMVITPEGVAYIILDARTRTALDLQDGETEGFVNIPLGIGKVHISIFLKEDAGHYRVSIRSKRGWSANRLARESFHGGGHEQAAGGKLYFPADIPHKEDAAPYIEEVTARFLQGTVSPQ
ncbi:MAG: DHH family phosphoesterase [Bacteroidales bacterium]|nr:DHH family phosphoesterase [Bacteroidales bacterium]